MIGASIEDGLGSLFSIDARSVICLRSLIRPKPALMVASQVDFCRYNQPRMAGKCARSGHCRPEECQRTLEMEIAERPTYGRWCLSRLLGVRNHPLCQTRGPLPGTTSKILLASVKSFACYPPRATSTLVAAKPPCLNGSGTNERAIRQ